MAKKTVRLFFYNTHLFGEAIKFFQKIAKLKNKILAFEDDKRTRMIADHLVSMGRGASGVDVVGLCEVWDSKLDRTIKDQTESVFPHYYRPRKKNQPGSLETALGSGLTILSKHPLTRKEWDPYAEERGFFGDAVAQKGYTMVLIELGNGNQMVLFTTHMQANADPKDKEVRESQMNQLLSRVTIFRRQYPQAPIVVLGDLNIVGEEEDGEPTQEYLDRIDASVLHDGYRVKHTSASNRPGYTADTTQNRLIQVFDDKPHRWRLDYALYEPNGPAVTVADCAVVRPKSDAPFATVDNQPIKDLSDHYGVRIDLEIQFA